MQSLFIAIIRTFPGTRVNTKDPAHMKTQVYTNHVWRIPNGRQTCQILSMLSQACHCPTCMLSAVSFQFFITASEASRRHVHQLLSHDPCVTSSRAAQHEWETFPAFTASVVKQVLHNNPLGDSHQRHILSIFCLYIHIQCSLFTCRHARHSRLRAS